MVMVIHGNDCACVGGCGGEDEDDDDYNDKDDSGCSNYERFG